MPDTDKSLAIKISEDVKREGRLLSIAESLLNPAGIPSNILGYYSQKKLESVRDIILSEVRQGDFSNVDLDDKIGIIYRFGRDAVEGVAKNNLRLMARLMQGLDDKQELTAMRFLDYANILSTLTENEIFLLSKIAKEY